jgi:hypothetical protein
MDEEVKQNSELDQTFIKAYEEFKIKLKEKQDAVNKAIKEVVELSVEYGIPINSPGQHLTSTYTPKTINKWSEVSEEILDEASYDIGFDFEDAGYWAHSDIC